MLPQIMLEFDGAGGTYSQGSITSPEGVSRRPGIDNWFACVAQCILLQSYVEISPLIVQPLTLFRPWSLLPRYFPD